MPVITGLQTSQVADANVSFALTFFPRARKSFYPKLCGTTRSSRLVEPFTIAGSAPMLQKYNGTLRSKALRSWKTQVPNLLFKNLEEIGRSELEFDQTRTIRQRCAQLGVRVAQYPDFLLAKRILTAHQTASATTTFEGNSYALTFDSKPLFSTTHDINGSSQSNIISGQLPNTRAAIAAQDIALSANQMQQDMVALLDRICSITDDQGVPMYPEFDPKESLVVVVPPILRPIAQLAFQTSGTIGGTNGDTSGATTNIGQTMVKRVESFGLLRGCPDIEDDQLTAVAPTNEVEWFAFIEDDFTRPFYWQRFVPKKEGETFPLGEAGVEGEAKAALEAAGVGGLKITPESADVYAATEIDHNFGALGANSQLSVVKDEKFFMSGRARGNIVYGPWMTAYKVLPSGGS